MDLTPTSIDRHEDGSISISWNDDAEHRLSATTLRAACPCANCRAKSMESKPEDKSLLPILTPAETRKPAVEKMTPVGNYAYTITFADGHDSGIFSLEYLRHLGERSNSPKPFE